MSSGGGGGSAEAPSAWLASAAAWLPQIQAKRPPIASAQTSRPPSDAAAAAKTFLAAFHTGENLTLSRPMQ